MKKFWQCAVGGTNYFGHQYDTLEKAKADAEVLARMDEFMGKRVYVLEAIDCCQIDKQPIKWGE